MPGRPLFFATAMPLSGSAIGLLAESHEGRPTKIEGNPDHPASLGATDAYAQASVLQLYDPDRSTAITFLGEIRPWGTFVQVIGQAFSQRQAVQGAGLRFLTESVASPTLVGQLQEVLAALPQAKWHQWEPVNRDNAHAGARLAFGEVVETTYRFDQARVVVSLGADFLGAGPGQRPLLARLRERPPRAQGEGRDEPAVRRRDRAVAHRLDRGPSPARARQPDRGDCAGAARGGQRRRRRIRRVGERRDRQVDRRRREGPAGEPRRRRRRRGRPAAAGRARARPRDERGARQRGHDRRSTPIPCSRCRSTSCSRCASWSTT